MIEKAKSAIKHPLIYGSGILFIGNLVANFFNFLFNIFMSRSLSVAEYGILASIIVLITLPNIAIGAIVPLVINFAGHYFAKGELAMIRGLYMKILKFILFIGFAFFFLFLVFIPQIGQFFHIKDGSILFFTDIIILLTFFSVINLALLQAKLAFFSQVSINIFGSIIKLLLGLGLVLWGLAARGAVLALLISTLFSYLISFLPIKFIFDRRILIPRVEAKGLLSYGFPSAMTLFGLSSFISADIILVKHFFNPTLAGTYAGLALVGKVIFYLSAPIGSVMFPLIVQKHSRKENYTNIFKLSLLFVFIPSILMTTFYFFFPEFTILFFLKKKEYLSVSPLLWVFGLFISLYCLLTILSNFYLSIKKTKVFIPICLGAILQIILIFIFHSSFVQIISISIIITFLLVFGLLIYYPYATKK